MPAMSPTMTEGGISSWKKKEGESFSVGDILLEIVSELSTSYTLRTHRQDMLSAGNRQGDHRCGGSR
jgi:hypothetical protein